MHEVSVCTFSEATLYTCFALGFDVLSHEEISDELLV